MSTFFEAMLWGAGVSTGMTLGVIGWFVTIELCKYLRGDKAKQDKSDDFAKRSLDELRKRNAIGEQQLASMQMLGNAIDIYVQAKTKDGDQ